MCVFWFRIQIEKHPLRKTLKLKKELGGLDKTWVEGMLTEYFPKTLYHDHNVEDKRLFNAIYTLNFG